jgi:predicted phage terminase large subunit-like protein
MPGGATARRAAEVADQFAKERGLKPLTAAIVNRGPAAMSQWFGENFETHIQAAPDAVQARKDLLDFTRYCYPGYRADAFHRHMAGWLQRVVLTAEFEAEKRRPRRRKALEPLGFEPLHNLIIEAPPQHGKSLMVSQHLPPFWLARNNDLPVLLTSYAADRAHDNARRARDVASSPFFRTLFPHLEPDVVGHWRANDWAFKGVRGYCFAAGVGGPVTGHGFGLGLIDDPFENWEKAQSETTRRSVYEWWKGTFLTRIWEGGCIIIIMTRWHEDDLVGRILAEEGELAQGGRWKHLRYPALIDNEADRKIDPLEREFGDPLAPSRFTASYLDTIRERVGPMVWNAEYQQRPTRPEGDFFKIERVSIETAPPASICQMHKIDEDTAPVPFNVQRGVRFWDLAATAASRERRDPDYTVGTLSAEDESGKWWVIDVVRARLDPEQVQQLMLQTAKLDGKRVKVRIEQEPGASGKSMISNYVKLLAGFNVEGVLHGGDKAVWSSGWAGQVNGGNVILVKAPWNKPWLSEHAGFPNAKHDDQVDSAAGSFNVQVEGERQWKHIKFLGM